MELFDYVKFLGMYWGEPGLQPLVNALGISKPQKISRGDVDGYLEFKKNGLYLVFSDEKTINIPNKILPEGAMVLSGFGFYLKSKDGYKPYTGKLSNGISSDATKAEVLKLVGIPSKPKYSPTGGLMPGEDDWNMRWDREGYFMSCIFSDVGVATRFAIQLPLDQA